MSPPEVEASKIADSMPAPVRRVMDTDFSALWDIIKIPAALVAVGVITVLAMGSNSE